jgi:hypothetical protein
MGIQPVQKQPTRRVEESKTAKRAGGLLGAIAGVTGGIAGAIGGGKTAGPMGAVAGAATGASGGFSAGQHLGRTIGERIEPSRTITENAPDQEVTQMQGFNVSASSKKYSEALQILADLPPEVSQPSSQLLTAALMQDLAQNNTRSV